MKLIGNDLKTPLYPEFYLNFASMVSRSQLENLATVAVQNAAAPLIKKVFDQYMNFVSRISCTNDDKNVCFSVLSQILRHLLRY